MQKKLTITLDEQVYEGLYRVIGRRQISHGYVTFCFAGTETADEFFASSH